MLGLRGLEARGSKLPQQMGKAREVEGHGFGVFNMVRIGDYMQQRQQMCQIGSSGYQLVSSISHPSKVVELSRRGGHGPTVQTNNNVDSAVMILALPLPLTSHSDSDSHSHSHSRTPVGFEVRMFIGSISPSFLVPASSV